MIQAEQTLGDLDVDEVAPRTHSIIHCRVQLHYATRSAHCKLGKRGKDFIYAVLHDNRKDPSEHFSARGDVVLLEVG